MSHRTSASPTSPQPESAPRACRICFETEAPSTDPHTDRVGYGTPDNESGRLLHPCKCTGSQKYVHELCLSSLRNRDPLQHTYSKCPTCGHHYELKASAFDDFLEHWMTHACATTMLTCLAIFLSGYFAIPLLSITMFYRQTLEHGVRLIPWYTSSRGWPDHFAQGSCLVGVSGIIMTAFDIAKLMWTGTWDLPVAFVFLMSFAPGLGMWGHIAAGVLRMMYEAWCVVRGYCRRYVESGERVLDYDGHTNQ